MKRFASFLLASAVFAGCGSADRESILKVYNWSNYIAEGVIDDFEEWYEAQTGEKIEVIYQTFDINETMLSKIEKGHEDYDVVCPSDYMIERMLNGGMLSPLDFASLPDSINYIRDNQSPYITRMFSEINPDKNANDYAVAFMWGTTGILYNPKYVTDEEASTWDCMINPKFKGRMLVKDAPRDVFAPVLIHLRQDGIKSGATTIHELMRDSSDKSLEDFEAFMKQAKDNVCGWEADFGKEQMTQEKAWLSYNWSGDAVWAIEEAAKVGVELRYAIPEEGSTVWFDGWVIPKYAVNVKAATYFINFMCRPDIAIRNMDETGYIAANGDASVLESQIDSTFAPIDISYFFPGADSVCVDPALYPERRIIENCALEHDWGERTGKLIETWSRIKGDNATPVTYIVVSVIAAILIVLIVSRKIKSRKKSRHHGRKK